ncbi:MAG TPA: MFS transporter [Phycisphaerae bacterium]|nr:MFS transporter [Phycisphaerae bacterium]
MSHPNPRLTLAAAATAFFMVILDTTVVNVALGPMQSSLNADVANSQWIVDSYALIFAGLLLAGGAITDRFGARHTFTAGLALFTLSSVLCGAAPTLSFLIAARILQGIGAALLLPASLAALRHAIPNPAQRSKALGLWAATGSSALAAGPVLGGILIQLLGWRSIFWINLPVGLLAIFFAWTSTPDTTNDNPQPLNLPANALGILALASLSYAFIEFPNHPDSPLAQISIPLALLSAAAFILIELRHKNPLIPKPLWKHPPFITVTTIGFLGNFAYYGLVFFLGLFLERNLSFSPLHTGLCFLPLTASTISANPISGRWTAHRGSRGPMLTGQLLTGLALLSLAFTHQNFPLMLAFLFPIGFGMGLIVPAITSAALSSVDPAQSGIAAGILNTSRQIGGVLGVALTGLLLAHNRPYPSALSLGSTTCGALLLASTLLTLNFVTAHTPTPIPLDEPLFIE